MQQPSRRRVLGAVTIKAGPSSCQGRSAKDVEEENEGIADGALKYTATMGTDLRHERVYKYRLAHLHNTLLDTASVNFRWLRVSMS